MLMDGRCDMLDEREIDPRASIQTMYVTSYNENEMVHNTTTCANCGIKTRFGIIIEVI